MYKNETNAAKLQISFKIEVSWSIAYANRLLLFFQVRKVSGLRFGSPVQALAEQSRL